jgi:hypothetical protein
MIDATTPVFLPAVLTTKEFAYLIRMHPETVREKIRRREIAARGRPARIANRELLKFGVTMAEAARALSFLKQAPEAA